jgi:hypothetical protein
MHSETHKRQMFARTNLRGTLEQALVVDNGDSWVKWHTQNHIIGHVWAIGLSGITMT